MVEVDYPKIEGYWDWYMYVQGSPPPEHAFKDTFVFNCSLSWRVVTLIGFAIGLSCIFVCLIGVCSLIIWPVIVGCVRRTMIEYKKDPTKPKKNKRKWRDSYRKNRGEVVKKGEEKEMEVVTSQVNDSKVVELEVPS